MSCFLPGRCRCLASSRGIAQAYQLFVLHHNTAHAYDDDLFALRGLDIQGTILGIDFHTLDRFDTGRVFFFFCQKYNIYLKPSIFRIPLKWVATQSKRSTKGRYVIIANNSDTL